MLNSIFQAYSNQWNTKQVKIDEVKKYSLQ